jgi:hypothetical protein
MAVAGKAIDGDDTAILTLKADEAALRQDVQHTLLRTGDIHGNVRDMKP